MSTLLPAGSGGSIFWENLSRESLGDDEFSTLIAEDPTSLPPPLARPSTTATPSSSPRLPPPTHISLPPNRRMSTSPEKRIQSPLSPKLTGWNFLKRHAGPPSLQVTIPLSTSKPRSAGGAAAIGNGFPSASPNSATKRPGNSRSTTWTANLPNTRALTLDQPTPPPSSSSNSQLLQPQPHTPLQQSRQQPYYPPSPYTAAPQPTHPTPPIVVVPSVLTQRGRFGLFRRASVSPKVEKGGFFGFVGSSAEIAAGGEKDKRRLKGLGLKKQKRGSIGAGTGSPGPPSSPSEGWLSPPQSLFSPASQQQRFPSSSSTGSTGFQRPSSPLSPYYTPPEHPSYRHSTCLPSSSSPAHSPPPTLYNQPPPISPSRTPYSALPGSSSPRASQRIIAGAGRPSLDFHPGRPHVAFPYHARPSSSSLCSASADDEDDEEDFPFREARPVKASKRKIRPKSQHSQQRGRSCSPSRMGAGGGAAGTEDHLEGAKVTRAWWKVASGGVGLAEMSAQERANRGAGMLESSAATARASMEGGGAGRGSRRGSAPTKEEGEGAGEGAMVVEREFKVTSRPSSPASSFKRGPHPAGAGSGLRPEGENGSGRSSLVLDRTEGAGGVASSSPRELTNPSSTPSTANSITSHPSPTLTPRFPSSNPVSRSNSLLASSALRRPRIPSRSSSINRSWTPPTKHAPPPPFAPSSVPTTLHLATSFPPQHEPTLPLLPLGQPTSSSPHDDHDELEDAPSPLFFAHSSRISPTHSNSSRSQENSSSSDNSNGATGSTEYTRASSGGTDQETEPTDDGEELGTSCEGGE